MGKLMPTMQEIRSIMKKHDDLVTASRKFEDYVNKRLKALEAMVDEEAGFFPPGVNLEFKLAEVERKVQGLLTRNARKGDRLKFMEERQRKLHVRQQTTQRDVKSLRENQDVIRDSLESHWRNIQAHKRALHNLSYGGKPDIHFEDNTVADTKTTPRRHGYRWNRAEKAVLRRQLIEVAEELACEFDRTPHALACKMRDVTQEIEEDLR